MSGGSYNYLCYRVEEEYVGKMYDLELDVMMKDLSKVLHDLEWWDSGDTSEEKYRDVVQDFKDKWFGKRDYKLRELLLSEIDKVKENIKLL